MHTLATAAKLTRSTVSLFSACSVSWSPLCILSPRVAIPAANSNACPSRERSKNARSSRQRQHMEARRKERRGAPGGGELREIITAFGDGLTLCPALARHGARHSHSSSATTAAARAESKKSSESKRCPRRPRSLYGIRPVPNARAVPVSAPAQSGSPSEAKSGRIPPSPRVASGGGPSAAGAAWASLATIILGQK
jgi:hypothetical protein